FGAVFVVFCPSAFALRLSPWAQLVSLVSLVTVLADPVAAVAARPSSSSATSHLRGSRPRHECGIRQTGRRCVERSRACPDTGGISLPCGRFRKASRDAPASASSTAWVLPR